MKISIEFIVYGDTYTGTAEPRYDNRLLLWYEVQLDPGYLYTVRKIADKWKTDFKGIPEEFVQPTGEAIDAALNIDIR